MNELKPIETIYKGYRFRSRLEARWGDYFAAFPAVENGRFYLDGDDSNYKTVPISVIRNAFRKARQARFEHGERPTI